MFNYLKEVKEDVKTAIADNYNLKDFIENGQLNCDELFEKVYGDLWVDDAVTGNASGSYTFNREEAKQNVLADYDTVKEALAEFCVDPHTITEKFLSEDFEWLDVTARCYVLSQAISEALDDIEKDIMDDIREAHHYNA